MKSLDGLSSTDALSQLLTDYNEISHFSTATDDQALFSNFLKHVGASGLMQIISGGYLRNSSTENEQIYREVMVILALTAGFNAGVSSFVEAHKHLSEDEKDTFCLLNNYLRYRRPESGYATWQIYKLVLDVSVPNCFLEENHQQTLGSLEKRLTEKLMECKALRSENEELKNALKKVPKGRMLFNNAEKDGKK